MNAATGVKATLNFADREIVELARSLGPVTVDLRVPGGGERTVDSVECLVRDARASSVDIGLDTTGFTLVHRPSEMRDWFDNDEVMRVYYDECTQLARELTGASHAFTFDHIIREPGQQVTGGGVLRRSSVTSTDKGGGYISAAHMDYTDNSVWHEYLALHDVSEPRGASRVLAINFWRPLSDTAEREPLAVCDARTVAPDDLMELRLLGYGHEEYSWHNIGIDVFDVAASPEQQWYYFPNMGPDEVLLMKSYDCLGVIGRGCPHASFTNPSASTALPSRRSIELRVLCYVDAH
jgi:hypothetical protein